MKKSREPWLDWDNSLELAEKARFERVEKAKLKHRRNHLTAFVLVIFYGFLGFHRFYLYDVKKGWKFFWAYMVFWVSIAVVTFVLPENLQFIPTITFLFIWAVLLIYEVPYVKKRLIEINEEVENYDR